MPSLNSVHIIGNCTRDPELRHTPGGVAVVDLGLAINRNYVNDAGEKKTDTTFLDVTLWAKTAELVAKYVKKGAPIFVEGRIQMDAWQDKQTNQQRTRLKVVGESVQLLGVRPQTSSSENPARHPSDPVPSEALVRQRQDRERRAAGPSLPTEDPDDIPF